MIVFDRLSKAYGDISAVTDLSLRVEAGEVYALLGAFQFAPGFRRRLPGWHRAAGRLVVLCGPCAATGGPSLSASGVSGASVPGPANPMTPSSRTTTPLSMTGPRPGMRRVASIRTGIRLRT